MWWWESVSRSREASRAVVGGRREGRPRQAHVPACLQCPSLTLTLRALTSGIPSITGPYIHLSFTQAFFSSSIVLATVIVGLLLSVQLVVAY
jgi:hypothetical protein